MLIKTRTSIIQTMKTMACDQVLATLLTRGSAAENFAIEDVDLVEQDHPNAVLLVSRRWATLERAERLLVIKEILAWAENRCGLVSLRWHFSNVELDPPAISSALADWETDNFPILSLIDVIFVESQAHTVGFAAISGFEVFVSGDRTRRHHAMVMAAHMALHLVDGSQVKVGDIVRSGRHRGVVAVLPGAETPELVLSLVNRSGTDESVVVR